MPSWATPARSGRAILKRRLGAHSTTPLEDDLGSLLERVIGMSVRPMALSWCPVNDRCPVTDPHWLPGRLRYKARGHVTMHAATGEAQVTPREMRQIR